jgi:putative hydrolase of the HAD superfamily
VSPRAITLDALGTLVELEPPAPLLAAALAVRGIAVPEAAARAAIAAEISYYRAHHDEAGDAAGLAGLRDRCTEVLRAALLDAGADVAALPHADLRDALLGALRFRAYPEVPGALRALRGAGVRLVVVSNWDVSLHEALERTGLRGLVDGAVSSAEAGAAKPDPAIFARALALAGVPAAEAWHAGDSPEHDVAGARAAGLRPVLVARDGTAGADGDVAVVRSLTGLARLGP